MSTPEDAALSRDAQHSTYEAATDVEETIPPSGPSVIQTRGLPVETTPAKTTTKTTAASS